jgi:hypothetical protein
LFLAALSQSLFLWLLFSCFSSVFDSFSSVIHCAFNDFSGVVDCSRSGINSISGGFRRSVSSGVKRLTSIFHGFFRSSGSSINRFARRFDSRISSWLSFFFWRASGKSQRGSADDQDVLHYNTPVVGQMTGKAHSTSLSLLKVHFSGSRYCPDC